MTCVDCRRRPCEFHSSNGMYVGKLHTNVQYSKQYTIIDPYDLVRKTVWMRPQERKKAKVVEISEKTATCSVCRKFVTCTVFTTLNKVRNGCNNMKNLAYCRKDIARTNDREIVKKMYPELRRRSETLR